MPNRAAEYHKNAAEHHESAAHHHKEAAKHYEGGSHEKAVFHARLALGHHVQALHHALESASYWGGATAGVKAIKNGRGRVKCRSCNISFLKTQLTSRGQCLSCAKANTPPRLAEPT
jgi:hypothetical protein